MCVAWPCPSNGSHATIHVDARIPWPTFQSSTWKCSHPWMTYRRRSVLLVVVVVVLVERSLMLAPPPTPY